MKRWIYRQVLRWHRNYLMNLCRETGGENSPYFEELEEADKELARVS